MRKKKTVFLPMTQNEFERSFRENVRHVNVKNDERTSVDGDFVGRLSKNRFSICYRVIRGRESCSYFFGKIQPCPGGLYLTYQRRQPYYSWLYNVILLCYLGYAAYRIFLDIAAGTFHPSLEGFGPLLIFLPVIAAGIITRKFIGKPVDAIVDASYILFDKLNDICGGSLPREEKELERR